MITVSLFALFCQRHLRIQMEKLVWLPKSTLAVNWSTGKDPGAGGNPFLIWRDPPQLLSTTRRMPGNAHSVGVEWYVLDEV